eukprot:TRINITY_DN7440_c0_g1_i1.p1 TRINITY_DN7440_c0_g1~~TRINITY_DN7440_c0_g1_i1.p1  ORF type:complete len:483 (-),score=148.68 TRINITY_DN7440_c0_g1_i1:14-1327(-)
MEQTKLDKQTVQKAIIILIQHNCITWQEQTRKVGSKQIILCKYIVLIEDIIQRLRFPKFVYYAKEVYGNEAELLMEELIQHGRLTSEECITRAAALSVKILGAQGEQRQKVKLREVFHQLAQERYIDVVRPPVMEVAEGVSVLISSHLTDEKTAQWKVNFERFNIRFRNELCIEAVREKFDAVASDCLRIIVSVVEPAMKGLSDETSRPFRVSEIFDVLKEKRSSGDMSIGDLMHYCDQMSKSTLPILEKVGGMDTETQYVLQVKKIVLVLQQRLIESVIAQKFGGKAARLWKIILEKKLIEQKQIAQIAMVSFPETCENLYRLLQQKYVSLVEVPRTADRAPQKNIYLWNTSFNEVMIMITEQIFKTIFNLRKRLYMHVGASYPLLSKAEADQSKLTQQELDTIDRIQALEDQIEVDVLRLDDMIFTLSFKDSDKK